MRRVLIIIALLVVIGGIISSLSLLLSIKRTKPEYIVPITPSVKQNNTSSLQPVISSPSPTVSPTISPSTNQLSRFVNQSLPIVWQKVKSSQHVYNKPDYSVEKISGIEQDGEIIYKNPSLYELANVDYLRLNGWKEDMQIAANGPTGSEWGYSKIVNGKKQVVIFSYTNNSFVAPPSQTTCPCKFSVSVFLRDPLDNS